MTKEVKVEYSTQVKSKKEKSEKWIRLTSNRLLVTGSIILLFVLLIGIFAPILAPYDVLEMNPQNRFVPPSVDHLFGTDNFGRDIFSRVMHGVRLSLVIGFFVTLFSTIIGLIVGLLAAYNKILDHILMRICDGLFAFPSILLAIAITAALGPKTINVVIALVLVFIPSVARIVRSQALVVKEKTFIESLRAQGANPFRILFLHIAPNVMSPLIVQVTYIFAVTILTEASLSFLGAGVPAPEPSLGNLLYDGKLSIYVAWWMTVFPGIFIVLIILGLNLFGDGLRDFLDPKAKQLKKRGIIWKRKNNRY
ncbi:ABC transporter permease [Ureibacillus acetophenoni]|uniref:Peptide/nickel transport system permease protein n=1 Tax=Ureibacillus acetophenoni TaxID=614649 RepID=A0A285UGC6_9BACL|nr:ABC transporter permease [Ureibacillus acetophenoni]SOC40899.1 peptide/nickel transport system permease protein [Ureibacillus acetophenoni]